MKCIKKIKNKIDFFLYLSFNTLFCLVKLILKKNDSEFLKSIEVIFSFLLSFSFYFWLLLLCQDYLEIHI